MCLEKNRIYVQPSKKNHSPHHCWSDGKIGGIKIVFFLSAKKCCFTLVVMHTVFLTELSEAVYQNQIKSK
jgi:hypothetical protein